MKTEIKTGIDMSSDNTGRLLDEARRLHDAGVNPNQVIRLYGRAKNHGTSLNTELEREENSRPKEYPTPVGMQDVTDEVFARLGISRVTGQPVTKK